MLEAPPGIQEITKSKGKQKQIHKDQRDSMNQGHKILKTR